MQIVRIEHRRVAERLKIVDRQIPIPQRDKSRSPQFLQRAIDVDNRETRGISHVHLSYGERKRASLNQTDHFQTLEKFADDVSNTLERVAAPEI